jgi:hypothetical protein
MAITDEQAELAAAVEHANQVFSGYGLGAKLIKCSCGLCMGDESERLLRTTPLREVSHWLMSEYTWSAPGDDVAAGADEMRYFLPRYFEFIAAGEPPNFGGEMSPTLKHLKRLEFRGSWLSVEVAAIDRFFPALLASHLAAPLNWYMTEFDEERLAEGVLEVLCMIVSGGGAVPALLALWKQRRDVLSDAHLASVITDWASAFEGGYARMGSLSPFWDDLPAESKLIVRWLLSVESADRLEQALLIETEPRLITLFQAARDAVVRHL